MKVHIPKYDDDGRRDISVEIEPHDTWNVDTTLALVILPTLRLFRNTTQSAHHVETADVAYADDEAVRNSIDYMTDVNEISVAQRQQMDTDEYFNMVTRRWWAVLDTMIFAFDRIVRRYELEEEFYESSSSNADEKQAKYEEEQKKTKFGLMLFAKYYDALWD